MVNRVDSHVTQLLISESADDVELDSTLSSQLRTCLGTCTLVIIIPFVETVFDALAIQATRACRLLLQHAPGRQLVRLPVHLI
jgi:hypothetical protein